MTTTILPPPDGPLFQRWLAIIAALREQAAQLDLTTEDRRDATYWEIVKPLLDEAGRMVSLV